MELKGKIALGFRAHSGWAAMVAVANEASNPVVLRRDRIELVERAIPRSWQPYHAAAEMELADAGRFLKSCAAVAKRMAQAALRQTLADLRDQGYEALGCGLLLGGGRPSTDLAKTLASHPAIHTAEGEFFRNAVKAGAEACGLPVTGIKESELFAEGADRFGIPESELLNRVTVMGKSVGPPWTLDQKHSTLAAWLVIAACGNSSL